MKDAIEQVADATRQQQGDGQHLRGGPNRSWRPETAGIATRTTAFTTTSSQNRCRGGEAAAGPQECAGIFSVLNPQRVPEVLRGRNLLQVLGGKPFRPLVAPEARTEDEGRKNPPGARGNGEWRVASKTPPLGLNRSAILTLYRIGPGTSEKTGLRRPIQTRESAPLRNRKSSGGSGSAARWGGVNQSTALSVQSPCATARFQVDAGGGGILGGAAALSAVGTGTFPPGCGRGRSRARPVGRDPPAGTGWPDSSPCRRRRWPPGGRPRRRGDSIGRAAEAADTSGGSATIGEPARNRRRAGSYRSACKPWETTGSNASRALRTIWPANTGNT